MMTPAQESKAAQIGGYKLPIGLMVEFNDAWDSGDDAAIKRASDKIQSWKATRGRPSVALVIGGIATGLAALGGLVYAMTPSPPSPPVPLPPPPPPPVPGSLKTRPVAPPPPPPKDPLASSAGGLLLKTCQARKEILPETVDLVLPSGLTVHVMVDAIRAACPGVDHEIRLPVSYREAIEICNLTDSLPLTAAISDLFWQYTTVWHIRPVPIEYLSDPRANVTDATKLAAAQSVGWSISHSANIDNPKNNSQGQPFPDGSQIADVGKDWILDPLLASRPDGSGAVEYGWRDLDGTPRQPVSSKYDWNRFDYANTCRLMKRTGEWQGQTVQLLNLPGLWLPAGFPISLLAPFKAGK